MESAAHWGGLERDSAWWSAESRRGLSRGGSGRYVRSIVRNLHTSEEGKEGKGWVHGVGGCIIWLLQAKNEEKVKELV